MRKKSLFFILLFGLTILSLNGCRILKPETEEPKHPEPVLNLSESDEKSGWINI